MREKPSFNAAAVATLTRGERLEVLETTGDGIACA